MAENSQLRITGPVLISCAAFVVIVAGLRAAQSIVVPFLAAAFVAMICLPPLRWLQEKRLPTWLALLVITAVIVLVGLGIIAIFGTSVNQLRSRLPEYEQKLAQRQDDLVKWLKERNIDIGHALDQETFSMQRGLSLFGDMLGALGSVLSDALVIAFTLFFMLFEAAEFPKKLRAIGGGKDAIAARFENIQASVRRYLSLKSRLSLLSGVCVAAWLWWLGVDFALVWGLLSFLFNFIPNIGAFIAAVPAIALAFLQLGPATAIYAAAGYLVIETTIGSIIEPRLMGRGLGLSPLVVFLSLVFWGWVLGPVGMLLSVPLTMIVKIVLDNSQDMRWLGIILGAEAPEGTAAVKASGKARR
jgi:predicted PurR-regulated permease PerM